MAHALLITVVVLLAAGVVSAGRHGVIIYPVGDSATAGDAAGASKLTTGGRYAAHYSYRRYLYHMLHARGYEVRFAGSQSDCGVPGLDYDSHHDGYPNAKCDDIRNHVNSNGETVKNSIRNAIKSLKAAEAEEITLIKIVSAGAEDIYNGRVSKDISESSLRGLVDTVDQVSNVEGLNHRHTLVVPSPPPGGKREKEGNEWHIVREFNRDSKYEDYRFFLTWRGGFYASKTAADCFSYFDFLRHYNKEGTQLNAYGDMSLARCIYDNIKVRKLLPKVDTALPHRRQCSEATASLLLRKPESKAISSTEGKYFEPTVVNKALAPLTTITVPAVLVEESYDTHPTCAAAAAEGDGGAAVKKSRLEADGDDDGGKKKKKGSGSNDACKGAPLFPAYEPFQSTTRDLWNGE